MPLLLGSSSSIMLPDLTSNLIQTYSGGTCLPLIRMVSVLLTLPAYEVILPWTTVFRMHQGTRDVEHALTISGYSFPGQLSGKKRVLWQKTGSHFTQLCHLGSFTDENKHKISVWQFKPCGSHKQGSSKDSMVVHLPRCLWFFQALFSITIIASHISQLICFPGTRQKISSVASSIFMHTCAWLFHHRYCKWYRHRNLTGPLPAFCST